MSTPKDKVSEAMLHPRPIKKRRSWLILFSGIMLGVILVNFLTFWQENKLIKKDHIAKIKIDGLIDQDDELVSRIRAIRDNEKAKAVLVIIDSSGGTTTGAEELFEEIRHLASKKPTVAQVNSIAASAAYMIATATDHIVARKSSLVGSIGVLVQYPDVSHALDRVGVKIEQIKSSPLKAAPSPFNPTTEEERATIRSIVMDSYDWFMNLVAERRAFTLEQIKPLADGKVYTGRQALTLKLIDALGGESEALKWLHKKKINKDLNLVEWEPYEEPFFKRFLMGGLSSRNIGKWAQELFGALETANPSFHGLLSVWKP